MPLNTLYCNEHDFLSKQLNRIECQRNLTATLLKATAFYSQVITNCMPQKRIQHMFRVLFSKLCHHSTIAKSGNLSPHLQPLYRNSIFTPRIDGGKTQTWRIPLCGVDNTKGYHVDIPVLKITLLRQSQRRPRLQEQAFRATPVEVALSTVVTSKEQIKIHQAIIILSQNTHSYASITCTPPSRPSSLGITTTPVSRPRQTVLPTATTECHPPLGTETVLCSRSTLDLWTIDETQPDTVFRGDANAIGGTYHIK